jgi:hypothetical protein
MIKTRIEIAAAPSKVRATFLDFQAWPKWHATNFISSIGPLSTPSAANDKATATTLTPGKKLACTINTMSFTPAILDNSATEFRWLGTLWGLSWLFTGEHVFKFVESEEEGNRGGCTLVQEERFSGVAKVLFYEGSSMWKETKKGFEGLNADLKRACEATG